MSRRRVALLLILLQLVALTTLSQGRAEVVPPPYPDGGSPTPPPYPDGTGISPPPYSNPTSSKSTPSTLGTAKGIDWRAYFDSVVHWTLEYQQNGVWVTNPSLNITKTNIDSVDGMNVTSGYKYTLSFTPTQTGAYRLTYSIDGVGSRGQKGNRWLLNSTKGKFYFDWSDAASLPFSKSPVFAARRFDWGVTFPVTSRMVNKTITVDPATVGTDSGYAVNEVDQQTCFYSTTSSKFYQFWWTGGTTEVFATSVDGVSWSGTTTVKTTAYGGNAWSFSLKDPYIYYVQAANAGGSNNNIYYRRGTINADGTITWGTERVAYGPTGQTMFTPTVCVDSSNYPWIGFCYDASGTYYPYVIKSSTNDGTWVLQTGFPYSLQIGVTTAAFWVEVIPLTSGRVACVYVNTGASQTIRIQTWTGSAWQAQKTTTANGARFSAVSDGGDNVLIAWITPFSTFTIWSAFYTYSTNTMAADQSVYATSLLSTTSPALSRDAGTGNYFCFWIGAPSASHLYYKMRISGTWDSSADDWLTDATIPAAAATSFSISFTVINNYICASYCTGSSNPYNVRFAVLTLSSGLPYCSVILTSSPATGAGFISVDGGGITTPQTYSWVRGSTHTLAANTPVAIYKDSHYTYSSWSDGGAVSHSYTVVGDATITANFLKSHTSGTSTYQAYTQAYENPSFYALGYHYVITTVATQSITIRSSADTITWGTVTTIGSALYASCYFDGTYAWIVTSPLNSANNYLYMYRATPTAGGGLTLGTARTVKSWLGSSGYGLEPTISVDSNGYPWITYIENLGSSQTYSAWVTKSSTNDGTWTTAGGFPYQLMTGFQDYYIGASVVRLTGGKMLAVYSAYSGSAYSGASISWDGAAWRGVKTFTYNLIDGRSLSAVSTGTTDFGYAASASSTTLVGVQRYSYLSDSWTGLGTTTTNSYYQSLGIDLNSNLYLVWLYSNKVYRNIYTGSWSGAAIWIDETTDTIPANFGIACSCNSLDGFIGVKYETKSASPWNEKYAVIPFNHPSIVITSSTTGAGYVAVDSSAITTPQTYTWEEGTTHTLAANDPANFVAGQSRYHWTSWSDSGALSHTYTTPSAGVTVTANFQSQYYLTVTGGSISTISFGTPGVNAILNPGAEVDTSNANVGGNTPGTLTRDTTQHHSGTASFKYVAPHGMTDSWLMLPTGATGVASTTYDESIWVLGTAGQSVGLSIYNSGDGEGGSLSFVLTGSWQKITNIRATGGSPTTIQLMFRLTVQDQVVYLDDGYLSDNWYNSGSSTTVSSDWVWGTSGGTRTIINNYAIDGVNQNPYRDDMGTLTTSSVTMSAYHNIAFASTTQYFLTETGGNGVSNGNLITNPSFESGAWSGGSGVQSSTYAKYGTYSETITASGASIAGGSSNWIDVRGASSVSISLWTKITSVSNGNLYFNIRYKDASGAEIQHGDLAVSGTVHDWTYYSYTFDPSVAFPAGTCYVVFNQLWWWTDNAPVGTSYIDGVQVTIGSSLPAWSDTVSAQSIRNNGWYDSGSSLQATSNWVWDITPAQSRGSVTNYAIDGSNQNPTRLYTGALTTSSVTMSAAHTLAFASTSQYYFSVTSAYDSPSGQAWYDTGSSISSTVTRPSGGYETTGWTGTGSLSSGGGAGSSTTGSFTISAYSTCTWNWALANQPPTNDACNADAYFDVNAYWWVNMTVSDPQLVADLKTIQIKVTTSNAKTFTLLYTRGTDTFSEIADPDGICTQSGSVKVNVDSDTDKVCFRFKITSTLAQKGNCDVEATIKDQSDATDVDTYTSKFSLNYYASIVVNDATHSWSSLSPGATDQALTSPADAGIDFTVDSNYGFNVQAKGNGNPTSGGLSFLLSKLKIHKDTLGSASSLTTSYANVGGLTGLSLGSSLSETLKLWASIPDPQPAGSYTYTLSLQVVSVP